MRRTFAYASFLPQVADADEPMTWESMPPWPGAICPDGARKPREGRGRSGHTLPACSRGVRRRRPAYAEVALLAPVGVPRVGDLPVLLAVLDAPADDLDRVAARRRAGGVLVDAALCRVSGASLGAAARRAQEQPVAQGAATRGAAVAAVQVKVRGTGRTA